MSTRSTRRPQSIAPLSSVESLLLAQATWERGAASTSWPAIAKIMAKHPLMSRPKSFFTAQSCHSMYETLMREAGLELNETNNVPKAITNRTLAEKHYRSRVNELRGLIKSEEDKFKAVLQELEEIRTGLWDQEIEAKVTGTPLPDLTEESSAPPVHESLEVSGPSGLQAGQESLSPEEKDATDADQLHVEAASDETITGPGPLTRLSPQPTSSTRIPANATSSHTAVITESSGSAPSVEHGDPRVDDVDALSDTTQDASPGRPVEVDDAEDVEMTEAEALQHNEGSIEQSADGAGAHAHQREEEEEEELRKEEENKEEEEETSQDQGGDQTDAEQNEEAFALATSTAPVSTEARSEHAQTPEPETAVSEADGTIYEGQPSEPEEPVATRRSTRRRKSSATSAPVPITTKARQRARARRSESEPQTVDTDNDVDVEIKEDTSVADDERISSPFEVGISRRRDGKRKASFVDSLDSPHDRKRMRDDSEPVDDDEPGPSSHNTRGRATRQATKTEEQVAAKKWQTVINLLHSQISAHRNGTIFHNPIKNSEAPDYHEIIKRPMDLKSLKTRVKDGIIANSPEYQRDIYLMFANAMMYNRPNSDVYAMTEDMMLDSEALLKAFRQTEGLVKRRP